MLFNNNNNNNNSEMSDTLYNPTVHLTQTELMEKFNLAFYEGQNLSKSDILATFDDNTTNTNHHQPEIKDDYLIDYLMTNNINNLQEEEDQEESYFDFNDFVDIFDRNLMQESSSLVSSTETEISSSSSVSDYNQDFFSQSLPTTQINHLDLDDIDLCDALSQSSLDLDNFTGDIQDLDELAMSNEDALPPITTITRNNIDFNNFIRSVPDNNLFFNQTSTQKSEFGHLIGQKNANNNFPEEPQHFCSFNNNQVVLNQNEALLQSEDDPLLSSSSLMYPSAAPAAYSTLSRRKQSESEESTSSCEEEISVSAYSLICQWENCYQIYETQSSLVKHIEKCHVEVKRGDEFTCFWSNCPRKVKPFNARYKLLIHMRVHSGEKPNKCPFEGCNKAFSRLENLKIHQRSHTGERPYLCQFPTCTKSFSNSSDRAKHQRTHFDTKPYACQVVGCSKKYTDPSSLRKHVKNHTSEEQMLIKKKPQLPSSSAAAAAAATLALNSREEDCGVSSRDSYGMNRKFLDLNNHRQKASAVKNSNSFYTNYEHNYSNSINHEQQRNLMNIKQDLKNKISEKNKLKNML